MNKLIVTLFLISICSLFYSVHGADDCLNTKSATSAYLKFIMKRVTVDMKNKALKISKEDKFCHKGDGISYPNVCETCLSNPKLMNKKITYDKSRESEVANGCVAKNLDPENDVVKNVVSCCPLLKKHKRITNQQVLACPILEDGTIKSVIYISNGPFTNDKKLSYFVYTDEGYVFPSERKNPQPTADHESNISVRLLLSIDVEDVSKIIGNQPEPEKKEGNLGKVKNFAISKIGQKKSEGGNKTSEGGNKTSGGGKFKSSSSNKEEGGSSSNESSVGGGGKIGKAGKGCFKFVEEAFNQ